jgi:hypothetical protein
MSKKQNTRAELALAKTKQLKRQIGIFAATSPLIRGAVTGTAMLLGAGLVSCSNTEDLDSNTSTAQRQQKVVAHAAPSKVTDIVRQACRAAETCAVEGGNFAELSNEIVQVSAAGALDLEIHSKDPISEVQEAELVTLGVTISARQTSSALPGMPSSGLLAVSVPFDVVPSVAALAWVAAITPVAVPVADHPINPINSEAVGVMRSDLALAQGVTGAGVTVGAISDGVTNLAASQTANELPGNCPGTPCVSVLGAGAGDEGTAMLELVHDMAPGANLIFQGTGGSVTSHLNALNALFAANVNVITEDIPFDQEPVFQQGILSAAGDSLANNGVSIYSSSGNRGIEHAPQVFAVGTGTGPDGVTFAAPPPGCTNIPDNVVAFTPAGDTTFDLLLTANSSLTLQWSEPRAIFPTVGEGGFTDLNLYVMDAALTTCLAESVGVQANGVGDTLEAIALNNPGVAVKVIVDVQECPQLSHRPCWTCVCGEPMRSTLRLALEVSTLTQTTRAWPTRWRQSTSRPGY